MESARGEDGDKSKTAEKHEQTLASDKKDGKADIEAQASASRAKPGTSASRAAKSPAPRAKVSESTPSRTQSSKSKQSAWRSLGAIAAVWFCLCFLDVARRLPRLSHQGALDGDDLPLAMLGYPCLRNVTSNVTQERLEALISAGKEQHAYFQQKKAEAIKIEDYPEAKAMKAQANEIAAKVNASARNLEMYTSAIRQFGNACNPQVAFTPAALSSPQVRDWYTEVLDTMGTRLLSYASACGAHDSSSCLDSSWSVLGHASSCHLAEFAIRMRKQIKEDARLKGSFIMHIFLTVRDWYVYGIDNNMYATLAKRKRSKMVSAGADPTAEEVCDAIIASSFKANEAVTSHMKKAAASDNGYVAETLAIYCGVASIVALCYLCSILLRKLVSKDTQGTQGEKAD